MNVAIVNPAVILLAEEFNLKPVTATYQTTVAIGTSALGPLLLTPIANVYGRRPAYLLSVFLGFASAVGSAKATSFRTLIVARIFNGMGSSAALGLGAGTVVDLFFEHHRGRAMGIFALMSTNGAHLAPIVGGYVAQARGWRWTFWVGAILNGAFFVMACIFMPETIFDRPKERSTDENVLDDLKDSEERIEDAITGDVCKAPPMSLKTYIRRLWIWDLDKPATRKIKATDFLVKPLSMLKYPSVAFPALYYAVTYGFASIEPALTVATLFTKIYHFDTIRNGLANGVSLLVGATLGELCSGPVTDAMMARARRQALIRGETAAPESKSLPLYATRTAAAIATAREVTTSANASSMLPHGRVQLTLRSLPTALQLLSTGARLDLGILLNPFR
uniref:Major facilitator superfamily (MFS) profile domain-containing protein n=1 Tax=Psilocybe cubensis TaxID=181762 RepID=A0A8H7Y900_PSICU